MAYGTEVVPYLTPSVVIGLGEWGRSVAAGAETALRDRSPELVRACPVLLLPDEVTPDPGLIRAHLRASRAGEVIRALEREGLLRLDPEIAPATHIYLIGSLAEINPLQRVAAQAEEAARELHASVRLTALVNSGEGQLPKGPFRFPVYVTQPLTSNGLVIEPAEYREALVETLVAAIQPGAGPILPDARPGLAALGIAWLRFHPAHLRERLGRRLSREAVARCLELEPPPQLRSAMKETGAWQVQLPAERTAALLKGLPFQASTAEEPELAATQPLFPGAGGRRRKAIHVRRCFALLRRRAERWERFLERNSHAQSQREGDALERSLNEALRAGPDGMARAHHLAETLAREAAHRQERPVSEPEPSRFAGLVTELERAEAMWPARRVAMALGLTAALVLLLWFALDGTWLTLAAWFAVLALGGAAYSYRRPRRIDRAAQAAMGALQERAESLARDALLRHMALLDGAQEQRCTALADGLARSAERLREHLTARATTEQPDGHQGALSLPLVAGAGLEPVYQELLPLLPELTAHLAASECPLLWRDPEALLGKAEELTATFLASRMTPDPGRLAARAHGDRLGERLHEAVRGMLDWSRPLWAGIPAGAEPERWLIWPEGLPCPAVPPEVQVLPAARSCAACLTVVRGLPEGEPLAPHLERKTTSA